MKFYSSENREPDSRKDLTKSATISFYRRKKNIQNKERNHAQNDG